MVLRSRSQAGVRRWLALLVLAAGLRAVQTPQGFETELLRRAYDRAGGAMVTDDASLVEFLGTPVHTVAGDTRVLSFDMDTVRRIIADAYAEQRKAAAADPGEKPPS